MKNHPRKVRFLAFVIMCIGFALGFIGVFVESKPLLNIVRIAEKRSKVNSNLKL